MIYNGEKYNYEQTRVISIEAGAVAYSAFADGVIVRHPADESVEGSLKFAVVPNEYDDLTLEAVEGIGDSKVINDHGDTIEAQVVIPNMDDTDDTTDRGRSEAAMKVATFGDVLHRVLDRVHGNVPDEAVFGIEAMRWEPVPASKIH